MNKMKIKIHEALSTIETLFDGDQGCVDINREYPGIFAYYNLDSERKSDDCTYYFKIERNKIKPIGFHAGTDEWDPYYFETTQDDWLNEGTGHTKEYRASLLKDLQTLISKGITY